MAYLLSILSLDIKRCKTRKLISYFYNPNNHPYQNNKVYYKQLKFLNFDQQLFFLIFKLNIFYIEVLNV